VKTIRGIETKSDEEILLEKVRNGQSPNSLAWYYYREARENGRNMNWAQALQKVEENLKNG
jgi:hypothetical protein